MIYDTRHADACWRNPAQDDFLGPPAKFMKFTNLKNAKVRSDGNMYGINGAYFYGPQAVGDYTRCNEALDAVPVEAYTTFQYVRKLNLSHNEIRTLPPDMMKLVLLEHLDCSFNYMAEFPPVLLEPAAAFSSMLSVLNLSHNLLTSIPPALGTFGVLSELHLAGNFWVVGGLPETMGDLKNLRVLDLSGLPSASTWLWDEQARRRHALPPVDESDRAVVTETEFMAYVAEFPVLVETFGLLGARAMFARWALLIEREASVREGGKEGGRERRHRQRERHLR